MLRAGGLYTNKDTGDLCLLVNYDIEKVRLWEFFKEPPNFLTLTREDFSTNYFKGKEVRELVEYALERWNNLRKQVQLKKITFEELVYGNICRNIKDVEEGR